MSQSIAHPALIEAPVLDVFAERWSTRIFDATAVIDEDALRSVLEAARWAPSASNTQPWHFIVGRRGTHTHAKLFDGLLDFNQAWAGTASVLIAFVTETERDGRALPWSEYDLGQSAAFLTVQAHAEGLATHQMGGIDRAKLRAAFDLPATYEPVSIMAVGTLGDPQLVSEQLREREAAPRVRNSLEGILIAND